MMRFFLLSFLLVGSLLLPSFCVAQLQTLDSDTETTPEEVQVTIDVLANDAPNGLALDPTTVDLDLTVLALGVQNTYSTPEGEWSVDGSGIVTFVPALNFTGDAVIPYNVLNALSLPALIPGEITVTVTEVNDLPMIASPGDLSIAENTNTGALPFTVGDIETAPGTLAVTWSSNNTTLIPDGNIVIGGSGSARTVTATPAANQFGVATITLQVEDESGGTASIPFVVTVTGSNDLPTITSPGDQSIAENTSTAALGFTVGDSETAAGTLTVTGTSSNTTLIPDANVVLGGSGAARTVTVTPAPNQFGSTSTITLQVEDEAGGTSTVSFVVTVTGTDSPPSVTDVTDLSIPMNSATTALAFTITDSDSPFTAIAVSAASDNVTLVPPAGIVLGGSAGNRTITVTPAANQSGSANIAINVNDLTTGVSSSFLLTVTNTTPTISAIADQTILEGSNTGALAFTVGDTETPVASLTLTGTSSNTTLVPDANIVFGGSGGSRNVTVTPVAGQTGTSTITVEVSDGALTAQETFLLTVNVSNTAPTITAIADQTIAQSSTTGALTFTISDAQSAASALTVGATSSDPTLIPDANVVLVGSDENRTVTVTPVAGQSGSSLITITVSDGPLSAQETFTVTVNANTAPTISAIANQTIPENSATGALAITVGDLETPVASLTLAGTSNNPTLIPNGNIVFGGSGAARTVTVTPTTNQNGSAIITVTVNDGVATAQTTFNVTVNSINSAPTITAITNQTINEDASTTALSFTVDDLDHAASSLTVGVATSDAAIIPTANIVISGTDAIRTVSVTPLPNQNGGPVTITLTVSDGIASTPTSFTVSVAAVNDSPTITAIGSQSTNEGTPTSAIAFTINDVDNPIGTLNVTASSSNLTLIPNPNISLGGTGTDRTVVITPAAGQNGSAQITINVSDGLLSAQSSFTLTVSNVDDGPSISGISGQSIPENGTTGPISFTVTDPDTDPTALTVTANSDNLALVPVANIVLGGSGTSRTVTITPVPTLNGTAAITLTVTDDTDKTATTTFNVLVNGVNDNPTITGIVDQTTPENTPTAPIIFQIGDAETPAADLVLSGLSGNTTLVPNANIVFGGSGDARTVTITPAANQSGTALITISVSDQTSPTPTSTTFTLTVSSVNSAPTITAIQNQTTTEDVATAALPFTITDADTAPEDLTLTASSSDKTLVPDANIVFFGTGNSRTVTVTPALNQSGTTTITLTVEDESAPATITFDVVVSPVNDAPTITTPAEQTTAENTASAPIAVTVADVDNDVSALTVSGTSANAALITSIVATGTGADRTVVITPAAGQSGPTTVTLTVSDGIASSQVSFPFTVTSVNDAPTISAIAVQTILEDNPSGEIPFIVNDQETAVNLLTVTATSSDETIIKNTKILVSGTSAARTVLVRPEANKFGPVTITLTVSDGTASAQTTFQVTVTAVNDPPQIAAQYVLTTMENTPITLEPGNFDIVDIDNTIFTVRIVSVLGHTLINNTITPRKDFDGEITATVVANDGAADSEPFFATISVTDVNHPPVITGPQSLTITADEPYEFSPSVLEITDIDQDADPKDRVLEVSEGTNYTLSADKITIVPASGYVGPLSVSVRVSDGKDFSAPFVIAVNVVLPSSQPRINAQETLFTDEDVPITISWEDLTVIDLDDLYPTGFTLNIASGSNYTVSENIITPAPNYFGFINAVITVNDGESNSEPFTLKIYVVPVNDAPSITVLESSPIPYEPGSGPVPITETFSLEDVDNDFIALAEVSIDSGYSASNDELIFENTATSPIRAIYDASTGILSMIGYATKDEYIEAIRSIKYNYKLTLDENGEQSVISTDPKYISITLNDGQLVSASKGRSIDLETSVDLDIPNAFTPDGLGNNETWAVQPMTNSDQFDKTVVRVFNKRGLLIYEAVGLEKEWDGTYNGEQLPADTYYYTIDLHLSFIKKTYKGSVMILR